MEVKKILKALLMLIIFLAGMFLGSFSTTGVRTKTLTETLTISKLSTTTETVTVTETVKPAHILIASEGYLYTSCIYNATEPQSDPYCEKPENMKALTLNIRLSNFGASDTLVNPREIALLVGGVEPKPFYVDPDSIIKLSPNGSNSVLVVVAYLVKDIEYLSYFIKNTEPKAIVIYRDVDGDYAGEMTTELIFYTGSWKLPEEGEAG